MEVEQWKQVEDVVFNNYRVSNMGRVINDNTGKFLFPYFNKHRRYYYISMQGWGHRKNFILHRLVAKLFVPNPNGFGVVDHIDCDRKNNCYSNLEWVTPRENCLRAARNGRIKKLFGEKSGRSNLNERNVRMIFRLHNMGFKNREIGDFFGIKQPSVSLILNKRRWPHIKI